MVKSLGCIKFVMLLEFPNGETIWYAPFIFKFGQFLTDLDKMQYTRNINASIGQTSVKRNWSKNERSSFLNNTLNWGFACVANKGSIRLPLFINNAAVKKLFGTMVCCVVLCLFGFEATDSWSAGASKTSRCELVTCYCWSLDCILLARYYWITGSATLLMLWTWFSSIKARH